MDAPKLCRRFRICIILAVELTILRDIISLYILINFCFSVLKLAVHLCYDLLTMHLSIILDSDQPDTHLLYFTIRLL